MRDEFTDSTKRKLAERVGYRCSYPNCGVLTVSASMEHEGVVRIGEAAHITAASPGGPRYDPRLSSAQRKHQSNGIWLCATHASLVDKDELNYTVETLINWKKTAEKKARSELGIPHISSDYLGARISCCGTGPPSSELSGTSSQDYFDSLLPELLDVAKEDLRAFQRVQGWPSHPIALNLKFADSEGGNRFNVAGLADTIEAYNEVAIIAPPGTGKTTTLLQLSEVLIEKGNNVGIFIPLGEWSSAPGSFIQCVLRRDAWSRVREEDLRFIARCGRLVLILDGWNEIDIPSRTIAIRELGSTQRDFPDLKILISTRRQALGVPLSDAVVVEVDTLTEEQQLEIAHSIRGAQGSETLEQAWSTPGIRELVTIPLYLTAMLMSTTECSLPRTKEEIIGLFTRELERPPIKAQILQDVFSSHHKKILTALAFDLMRQTSTTITHANACTLLKTTWETLLHTGEIATPPQPNVALGTLVDHHMLVRTESADGGFLFQHQQFQEWYASFEVQNIIKSATSGDQDARQKLRIEILNEYRWEEAILFACERASRQNETGSEIIADTIMEVLSIDPMLAAEMIYRSSDIVWDTIGERVYDFIKKWHITGKVDRAVSFMVNTGRSEFAPIIWPLVSDEDDQVRLAALRTGRQFRPSVLGADVHERMALLNEELRESILSEIAFEGDINGIELAVELACADDSPKVQASVISSLLFRRADRHVMKLLRTAPSEVWRILAREGYTEEIGDPSAVARLRRELRYCIDDENDPLAKIRMILNARRTDLQFGPEIRALVGADSFRIEGDQATWIINEAHKQYPKELASALLDRLEAGLKVPYKAGEILKASGIVVDNGPIVDLVLKAKVGDRIASTVIMLVGPKTICTLLDILIALNESLRKAGRRAGNELREKYYGLVSLISNTDPISFIRAILTNSVTTDPRTIALLSDLIARHGKSEQEEPLQLDGQLREELIAAARHWVEIVAASPASSRTQLADVARAIGRLAVPELVPALKRLLMEDLDRWQRSREEYASTKDQRVLSEMRTSWTLQYRRAFAAIGDDQVVSAMIGYLPNLDFGIDAAWVLKSIWNKKHPSPRDRRFPAWPDFSEVAARRKEREEGHVFVKPSPFAEAIFEVISNLAEPGSNSEDQIRALKLARIAFSMPYGENSEIINHLLQLPQPIYEKIELLELLVSAGEMIQADMVIDGIKHLLQDANEKPWLLDEKRGLPIEMLAVLPFSDRPEATLEGLELLEPRWLQSWQIRRVLLALGYVPGQEAENVLVQMALKEPKLLGEHEWLVALVRWGTTSSARLLLDFICEGAFSGPRKLDSWTIAETLASTMRANSEVREVVYQRYENDSACRAKSVLEHSIAEVADTNGILVMVRKYAEQGKSFDGILHMAIRHAAVRERPSAAWQGSHELSPVPLPKLRQRLLLMVREDGAVAKLAEKCLVAIDEFRDEYGQAETEPRHPDIDSGLPWPMPFVRR